MVRSVSDDHPSVLGHPRWGSTGGRAADPTGSGGWPTSPATDCAGSGATRAEITDSDPRSYPHTASWAHGLHDHREHLDGIQSVSRQYDTALALILFGDRVQETTLDIAPTAIPMPLALGLGSDNVQDLADLADQADITVT